MLNKIASVNDLKVRVLGIDPGTQRLGYSLGVIDFNTKTYTVLHANTINVVDLIYKSYDEMVETHSKNIAMYQSIYNLTSNLVSNLQPDWVICESPYMNSKFPLPYALLTLCTQAVQTAVGNYSSFIQFDYIDPARAKNAVGVKGNTGDKSLMSNAVLSHPDIKYLINKNDIDEHAIDSIAIGYSGFKTLIS